MSETFELDDEGLEAAQTAVSDGRCIVLPTDTVYGIGADPFSADAVQGLLDAKHRGQDMPPPVLIAERSMMRALVAKVPEGAKELAVAFWPGPLTLILDAQKSIGLHLGEARGTVALRVPNHDGTRALLRRTGPLAVSSANISGQPSAQNCADAQEQLGDTVAVYLDDGPTPGPEPSTIVDFSSGEGIVLRLGVLSLSQLQEVVPSVQLYEPERDTSSVDDETTALQDDIAHGETAPDESLHSEAEAPQPQTDGPPAPHA